MRRGRGRWWLFNFASSDGDGSYSQINFLGLLCGIPLGLLGGVLGWAVGDRPDATMERLIVAGVLLGVPVGLFHGYFCELIGPYPVETLGLRLMNALMPPAVSGFLAFLITHKNGLGPGHGIEWIVCGGLFGMMWGAFTHQEDFPPEKEEPRGLIAETPRKKRKKPPAGKDDDDAEDRPRRPKRRSKYEDEGD